MEIGQVINRGILGEPAFLLGFIAFIGLLLMKSSWYRIIQGTIKTMLGYVLLQIGASAAGSSLSHLSAIIQSSFQIIGIIPQNETIVALAQIKFGKEIAIIMLIGMVLHLLIARFSPLKYLFLTGHHILFMASLLASLLAVSAMGEWMSYLVAGIILACSMSLSPAIIQPLVKKVVGGNHLAIGHFNSIGYLLSGWIAYLFRSKKETVPSKKWEKLQTYFQDHMVVISVFTFLIFLISGLFVSSEEFSEMFSSRSFIVTISIQSIWFTAGVYIILTGVRIMTTEIIPAFEGIGRKLVPKAIPALDCPVLFPYSTFSAIIGFLLSFVGGIVAMVVLLFYQYTTIIPGVIPHFFAGGAAGVIANQMGGRRGLVISSLIHGFVITILPAFLIPHLSIGYVRTTYADSDFSIIGILLSLFLSLFQG